MKKIKLKNLFPIFTGAIILSACINNNPPPPSVIHADLYSTLNEKDQRKITITGNKLTIDDAIRIALANNPSYEETKLSLELAYNTLYKTIIADNFTFDVSGSAGTNSNIIGSNAGQWTKDYDFNVNSSLILFNGLRREMNILQQYEVTKQRDYTIKYARLTLIAAIQITYYQMATSETLIGIAGANAEFQKTMLDFEVQKRNLNLVTDDYVMNFELNYELAKVALADQKLGYKLLQYTLAALMGLTTGDIPENTDFMSITEIMEKINVGYDLFGVEYYLDLAIQQNPDLMRSRSQLMAAKYNLYASWGTFSPSITADGTYDVSSESGWSSQNRATDFSYGLNATWDLWNNERIFTIKGNTITVDIEEQRVYQRWIDLVKEVRSVYASLETSILKQQITEKAYHIALEQRNAVQNKYEMQVEDITRLNNVQALLVQTEAENSRAIMNIYIAKANLEKVIGMQKY